MAIEIEGIVYPEGFEPLPKQYDLEKGTIFQIPWDIRERLRFTAGDIPLIFDEENSGYKSFLAQCKADEKCLRDAVHREVTQQGVPVRIKNNVKSGDKLKQRRVSIFIRPPFVTSLETPREKSKNRMQVGDNETLFTFHFGANHMLQALRGHSGGKTQFTHDVIRAVRADQKFYTDHYGNWEPFARKFTSVIKSNFHLLQKDEEE